MKYTSALLTGQKRMVINIKLSTYKIIHLLLITLKTNSLLFITPSESVLGTNTMPIVQNSTPKQATVNFSNSIFMKNISFLFCSVITYINIDENAQSCFKAHETCK